MDNKTNLGIIGVILSIIVWVIPMTYDDIWIIAIFSIVGFTLSFYLITLDYRNRKKCIELRNEIMILFEKMWLHAEKKKLMFIIRYVMVNCSMTDFKKKGFRFKLFSGDFTTDQNLIGEKEFDGDAGITFEDALRKNIKKENLPIIAFSITTSLLQEIQHDVFTISGHVHYKTKYGIVRKLVRDTISPDTDFKLKREELLKKEVTNNA